MKVESESEVAQSCPTLRNPMDCSLPGSSIHGIFQATVLEWGAIAFSTTVSTSLQNLSIYSYISPKCVMYTLELIWTINPFYCVMGSVL